METTTLNQIFFNWTLKLLTTLIKRTLVRAQIKKRTLVFMSDKFSCAPPQRPLAGPEPTTTATTPTIFRSTRTTDPLWQYCRPRVSRWNDPRSWWLLVIYSVILPRTFRSLSRSLTTAARVAKKLVERRVLPPCQRKRRTPPSVAMSKALRNRAEEVVQRFRATTRNNTSCFVIIVNTILTIIIIIDLSSL